LLFFKGSIIFVPLEHLQE